MQGLDVLRRAAANLSARRTGQRTGLSRVTVTQTRSRGAESEILNLPVDASKWQPLQTSTGAFYFLPGYSVPGGPDVPR